MKLLPTLLALLVATVADAQAGRPLPPAPIEDLGLTQADGFDEFVGRALLIEFFAYW